MENESANTATDIDKITQELVRNIRRKRPCLCLDSFVESSEFGKWGLIVYAEYDFRAVGFHFVESETSWKRPGAIAQYNGLIDDGLCVVVLVPACAKHYAARMLKEQGGKPDIRLYPLEEALRKARNALEIDGGK